MRESEFYSLQGTFYQIIRARQQQRQRLTYTEPASLDIAVFMETIVFFLQQLLLLLDQCARAPRKNSVRHRPGLVRIAYKLLTETRVLCAIPG